MRDNANTDLGILFFVVILLFGVVLIGHALKWPIYVSILGLVGIRHIQSERK